MHRRCAVRWLVATLLLASTSSAQTQTTIDGAWETEIRFPQGEPVHLLFDLRTNGREVDGTVSVDSAPPAAFVDGWIRGDGTRLSFTIPSDTDDQELHFSGRVLDDEIAFFVVRLRIRAGRPEASDPIEFTVTRTEP